MGNYLSACWPWTPAAAAAQPAVAQPGNNLLRLEEVRPASAAAQRAVAQFQAGEAGVQPALAERLDRFDLADQRWLQHLSDEGYVVLADVLSKQEVAEAFDHLWAFLPGATGWQRDAPSTWRRSGLERCGLPQWGILKALGAGNCDAVWFCRTRPRVREAFEQIWGTNQLISSFDGFNVFLPWHHGRPECKTQSGWMHADQGPGRQGLHAIQGFVALTAQGARTGGLQVIPASHHTHNAWVTEPTFARDHDFCMVQQALPISAPLLQQQTRLVHCQAGDLVLWDSRTVHCNTPAQTHPTSAQNELLRVAMYTCLVPRAWASDAELQLRRRAYDNGYSCNHWPIFPASEMQNFDNAWGFQVTPFDQSQDGRGDLI